MAYPKIINIQVIINGEGSQTYCESTPYGKWFNQEIVHQVICDEPSSLEVERIDHCEAHLERGTIISMRHAYPHHTRPLHHRRDLWFAHHGQSLT